MNPDILESFVQEIEKLSEVAAVENAQARRHVSKVSDLTKRLKPGDLLFSAPDSSRSKGVLGKVFKPLSRLVQGTDYGHTAIYAGNGKIIESRIGEGVQKKHLSKMTGSNNVIASRVKATPAERKKAVEYADSQIGKGYSLTQLVRAGLPSFRGKRKDDNAEESDKLFCSALVANAYAKKQFSDKSRLATRPVEIMSSSQVKPIAALTRFNKEKKSSVLRILSKARSLA